LPGIIHMKVRGLLTLGLTAVVACPLSGQTQTRVTVSGGDVAGRAESSRLTTRIPGVSAEYAARVRIGGDSAQRIAMSDFAWRGRVSSVEIDEEDARVYWDVKIVPDSSQQTIVRYRVDALSGGILGIREFTGIRGLARRPLIRKDP
jgi:uncharacterized membrane protein YkoI